MIVEVTDILWLNQKKNKLAGTLPQKAAMGQKVQRNVTAAISLYQFEPYPYANRELQMASAPKTVQTSAKKVLSPSLFSSREECSFILHVLHQPLMLQWQRQILNQSPHSKCSLEYPICAYSLRRLIFGSKKSSDSSFL